MSSNLGEIRRRRVWLFDLDGTLVDSSPVHAAAFRRAIAEVAPELLPTFRYETHAGAGTGEVVARLGLRGPAAERLARRKQQLYRDSVDMGRVGLFPGAHRLLDALAGRGCAAFLVTGGSRASIEPVLAACALEERLQGVLSGDEVPAAKPDPLVYREACRRWSVDPDEVVAVEDSAQGVASAVGAGLVTVQVHGAGAAGAIQVQHLEALLSLLGGGGRP